MKTAIGALALFLALVAYLPLAAEGDAVTLTGKLVDMKCYSMNHKNHTKDHVMPDGKVVPGCASMCARMGVPVGLLEGSIPGGKVYTIITPSTQIADHMAKEARVTGKPAGSGAILPTKLEVKDETGAYTEVKLETMM